MPVVPIITTYDPKGFKRAQKDFERASKSMAGIGQAAKRAALGGIAIGAAAVGAGVKLATMASDVEESQNKVRVVFEESAKEVEAFASRGAKALGMTRGEALEAAGTFGNLLTATGLGEKQAATFSTSMVQLAADMASFNNASPEDTLLALRSGLSGETEPLKKFGVNLNEALLKQKALDLGLVKSTKGTLPANIKAQAAYALIMEQTQKAQGDFARTSDGLANQQRILKATIADLGAEAGAVLLPILNKVVAFVSANILPVLTAFVAKIKDGQGPIQALSSTIRETLGPKAAAVFDAITGAVAKLWDGLKTVASWVQDNRAWLEPLAVGVLAMVAAYKTWKAVTGLMALAQAALNVVLTANPIGVVVMAVAGLVAALIYAYKTSDKFRAVVDKAFKVVKEAGGKMLDFFRGLPGMIGSALGNLGDLLKDAGRKILQGLWDGLLDKWRKVKEWVGGIGKWIKDHKGPLTVDAKLLVPAGKSIMDGLGAGLASGWREVASQLDGYTVAIGDGTFSTSGSAVSSTTNSNSYHFTINAPGGDVRAIESAVERVLKRNVRSSGGYAFGG